ncbi:general transcription factor IIF subunit 2 [Danaus plexippus]|uniref:General transcription factor IIF subunit 2 n=1 Tax=Danaus plexippus plexippus TaxID=278856 RepID=A0A212FA74_DANPL|nr:general transcription factor IIF subunit 2 [Danaus plexippus]OWR50634.1 General transcription factor IIF subunit 2 [Danaus plexippus plexippus]
MSNSNTVPHVDRELDLSNTGRGVWLVKVPKYIANKWDKASGDIEVGKLKISRVPGQRAQVQLSLSEAVLCLNEPGEQALPKEHRLDVSNVTRQSLGVFSHAVPSNTDTVVPESEKLYMEGRIVQKLECKPYADPTYYKLKSESIRKALMPQRQVQQLKGIVQNFKPVSDHKHNIDYQVKKKAEGKKARDDKESVLNVLFAAFEKHQYYNIKDLQNITRQPIVYLKEILKEVCNYNLKNPHKNMWELKPEYRHYKQEAPVETKEDPQSSDSD